MKNKLDEQGFTLVEMLIVLFIIAVLIMVTIPNVTKHFSSIDDKGCEAYQSMVQGQVQAYKLNHKQYPTFTQLETEGYIGTDGNKCPDGRALTIDSNGRVNVEKTNNGVESTTGG